jgi:hypothetical protein
MRADEMRCGRPGECENENLGPVSMQRRGRLNEEIQWLGGCRRALQRVIARTAR